MASGWSYPLPPAAPLLLGDGSSLACPRDGDLLAESTRTHHTSVGHSASWTWGVMLLPRSKTAWNGMREENFIFNISFFQTSHLTSLPAGTLGNPQLSFQLGKHVQHN